jgi:hypothetical protein
LIFTLAVRVFQVGDGRAGVVVHVSDQRVRPLGDLVGGAAGDLHQQPAGSRRKLVQRLIGQVLLPLQFDQPIVEALHRERPVRCDARNSVGRGGDVGVAENDENPVRQSLDEAQLGVQHRDQRALAADEGTRDVEPVLRQQRWKGCTRRPAAGCPGTRCG